MAWIKHENLGPGPMTVISSNPAAMEDVHRLHDHITFGGSVLTRVQEEMIATVVSATNKCRY